MANSYPTAVGYRARAGTVRVPAARPRERRGPSPTPRRTPGRPPARPRPTYRPAPQIPRPSVRPSPGVLRGYASALRGLGPYGLAFAVGWTIGEILFGPEPAPVLAISNPGNWDEYICSSPAGGSLFTSSVTYPITVGVSASNCIGGQFAPVGPGTPLRIGYWQSYGPAANQNAHVASFLNAAGTATPIPELEVLPQARPVIVTHPWVRDAIGPLIRSNPLLNPVGSPVGPEAGPVRGPGAIGAPSPGVGNEGYASGEPNNQPGQGSPSVRLSTRPNSNPRPPGRNTKERKTRPHRLVAGLQRSYGNLTEGEDLIDAFHKAIDPDCGKKAGPVWDSSRRGRGEDGKSWRKIGGKWVRREGAYRRPTAGEKFQAVYRHFNCVDLTLALANFLENEVEDRAYGLLGDENRRASRRRKGPFRRGWSYGPAL